MCRKLLPALTLRGLRSHKLAYWLLGLLVITLAASDAGDNSGSSGKRAGKKPRSGSKDSGKEKKPLSEAQLEQRRKAGKARAKSFTKEYQASAGRARAKAFTSEYQSRAWYARLAKLGTEYLSQMGKRGWHVARMRHPQFYERGGLSSRKHTLARLEKRRPDKAKVRQERSEVGIGETVASPVPENKEPKGN